ncbi:MAG TPA: hypothetical protein VMB27_07925 [Solirubrobacteraceae bacterium]|nr:hypothetical protein [Solirubrobacteraceae bacterium]
MTPLPIADFLAGSLLSLLLPIGVLIALVVWYVVVVRRRFAGDPGDPSEPDVPLTDASHATTGIPDTPGPTP